MECCFYPTVEGLRMEGMVKPNRLQHYYQLQVIMKPSPTNSGIIFKSLKEIKIDPDENDIKFIEDDWKVQLWVLQVWVGKYSVTE